MNYLIPFSDGRLTILIGATIFLALFYFWAYKKAQEIATANPSRTWVIQDVKRFGWFGLAIMVWGFISYFGNIR